MTEGVIYLGNIETAVEVYADTAGNFDKNVLRADSEDPALPISIVAAYSATSSGKAHVSRLGIYPLTDSGKNLITQWEGKYKLRESSRVRRLNLWGILPNEDYIRIFQSSEIVDELFDSVLSFVDDLQRPVTFLNKRDSKVATEFVSKIWKHYVDLLDEEGVARAA